MIQLISGISTPVVKIPTLVNTVISPFLNALIVESLSSLDKELSTFLAFIPYALNVLAISSACSIEVQKHKTLFLSDAISKYLSTINLFLLSMFTTLSNSP